MKLGRAFRMARSRAGLRQNELAQALIDRRVALEANPAIAARQNPVLVFALPGDRRTEELGAGYLLRTEDTEDNTTRATLVEPDGAETLICGGYEHECPEDMTWERELEGIFRLGLAIGKRIGAKEARG